ncbi:MAG: energy transducer TonB [Flavobacteriales bacterium]|nr:energy transducer TonB [Flavobacteriales bacterium]
MEPRITFSCSEHWENMRVGMFGRHCFQCDKEVVDFTEKTKTELIYYLTEHKGNPVCGRVRRDQVDIFHEFVEVCIWRSLQANRASNLAYYLLAIGGWTIAGCGAPPDIEKDNIPTGDTIARADSLAGELASESGMDSSGQHRNLRSEEVPVPLPIVGDIILDDNASYGSDHVERLPEVMPEFPGGQDSLFAFLRRNLAYPKWEHDNGIGGRLFVEFVVGIDGAIFDPRIVRSVKGSKNFDSEVLGVIGIMPAWKPGKSGEDLVRTKLVLPINFTLGV